MSQKLTKYKHTFIKFHDLDIGDNVYRSFILYNQCNKLLEMCNLNCDNSASNGCKL